MLLLRDHGTMTPRQVLEPAIHIARDGFALKPLVADLIGGLGPFFAAHWPSSAEVYLPGGVAPAGDELYALPAQGDTYARIVREAESAGGDRIARSRRPGDAWYEGFVAEAIDRFFRTPVMDTTGEAHAGLLTGQDLAGWRATVEEPVTLDYGDYTVCKPGPWAQGPVLLQQLALLRGFDLAAMDPDGPDFVHTVQECAKLAFADRDAFYGDPRFADVPLETLLRRRTTPSAAGWSATTRRWSCGPGRSRGHGGRSRCGRRARP